MRLEIPPNVIKIQGPILKLANFDVFQADTIFFELFGYGETESFDQIFEDSGYEGCNFILLTGDLWIISACTLGLFLPLHLVARFLRNKFNLKCGKFGKWLTKNRDWKWMAITFVMESSFELGFSASIAIVVADRNGIIEHNAYPRDWVAFILAFMGIGSLIAAPIFVLIQSIRVYKMAKEYKKKKREAKSRIK